jgi:hypothetical protein
VTNGSCGACGAPLEPGAVFCAECGSRVSDHAARAASVAGPVTSVPTPVVPPRGAPSVPVRVVAPMPAGESVSIGGRTAADGAVPSPYGSVTLAPVNSGRGARDFPPPLAPSAAAPAGSGASGRRTSAGPVAVAPGAVAPVGRRVGAFALDLLVALVVGGVVVAATGGLAGGSATALLPAQIALLLLGLGQWVAESFAGATIGGALLGIRTLSARTGRPAGLWRILLRQIVVALGSVACYVGQWVVVASGAWDSGPAQRGWHDKAAGTIVLRAGARGAGVASDAAYASAVARVVGQPVPSAPDPLATPAWATVPPAAPASVTPPPVAPASVTPPPVAPASVTPPTVAADLAPASLAAGASGSDVVPVDPETIEPVAPIPVPAFARDVAARQAREGSAAAPQDGMITGPPGFAATPRPADAPREPASHTAAVPLVPMPVWPPLTEHPSPAAVPPAPQAVEPGLGELEHTRLRPAAPAPPPSPAVAAASLRLVFDTGERVDVDGDGLVGRDPGAAPGVTHVVAITDPARSVSKVHLAFGLDGSSDRLWVVDRGSTNGTVLVKPDGSRFVLPAGARASVAEGWAIRFGERTACVERR